MTDRPILFSPAMIRALLDGRKSQTRRVLKPQPELNTAGLWVWPPYAVKVTRRNWRGFCQTDEDGLRQWFTGQHKAMEALPARPGDRLWVREAAWICPPNWTDSPANPMGPKRQEVAYVADDTRGDTAEAARDYGLRQRPSIHMPRWASRLTLTVTDVRVQRVQEISEADAWAEGVEQRVGAHCRDDFAALWNSLNAKRGYGWDANPWCAAISFRVHRCNIDQMPEAA